MDLVNIFVMKYILEIGTMLIGPHNLFPCKGCRKLLRRTVYYLMCFTLKRLAKISY